MSDVLADYNADGRHIAYRGNAANWVSMEPGFSVIDEGPDVM